MISTILNALPKSPFIEFFNNVEQNELFSKTISWLNWFVPVGAIIHIAEFWLIAIGLYYIYSIILRVARVIS